jgi:spore coat protein U-like protein
MSPVLFRLHLVAALALLAIPAQAWAATTQSTAGQVALLSPLSVLKQGDLDFGTLVVSGAGTALVDPVSGSLATTGGVTKAGTAAHPALFTGTGSKNSVVHIRLPQNPTTVTRVGGTETMIVSNWTLDGPANRKIPPGSIFDFQVGATLGVNANQTAGTYTGTFSITVQYP